MSVCIKSIILIFMFTILFVYQSFAGLVIERERYEKGGGERARGTIYIQENKIKFFDEGGQFSSIFDLDTQEMIQIDNRSRTYSTTGAEEYFSYYQQYAVKIESTMRRQLSELPPSERAKAEAMMKRQGISIPGGSGRAANITSKKTGDTKKIAGYQSEKYEVYTDGRLTEEIWITSDERFSEEVDMNKMTEYLSSLRAIANSMDVNGSSSAGAEKAYTEVFNSGFPMKAIDHPVYGNEIVENTIKVSKKNIDSNEFTAPSGYRKVELKEMLDLTN